MMIEVERFEQLVQRLDPRSRLLRMWPLKGGVSARVTALEVTLPEGQTKKLIVRHHGTVDLQHNPHIAADEYRLLSLLHAAGLPVPAPYTFDESGEIFPTPYIVVEYVEGTTEFAPADLPDFIRQLATQLARIHQLDGVSFLPEIELAYAEKLKHRPATLDDSLDAGRIRDTLELVWPLPRRNKSVLLHGDFWPGNILWWEGQLVAVIDWEDASVGDPLADLGNTRLELLWAFGSDALHQFTQHYQSLMTAVDFTHLPYWDLCAALRPASKIGDWAAAATRERIMRERHTWFVTQAYAALADQ
jgi:aminoglycoside phosphotransferase (APT) family kinase protein